MSYDVYGVGNALVDIQAQVSDEVIAELGFHRGIMTLVDETAQRRVLKALEGIPFSRCAGGSAANTVTAVADFGGRGAYAAKVGANELGHFFLEDMRNQGVTIEVSPTEGDTGTSVILISPDAQRTMLTHLGVNASLTADDIRADHVRNSKYVYVEGYLMGGAPTQRTAALHAMQLAKDYGVKVAFTVSDPFLIAHHRDEFWRLIEGPVDLLFCNLEEARALTGKHDPVECAVEIHRHAENVALTLGANGSLLMHEGEVIPIEGAAAEPVDSTGAGDMYAGALLYGITNGLGWKQAGHLASHAAARIVSQLGARLRRKFTRQEVAELLR
ncbi:MAG: adenosine kinase [Planctomycetaceae bacterium]|nr:MAG: adenosine kinase [Planctomycetaceae bacterium]